MATTATAETEEPGSTKGWPRLSEALAELRCWLVGAAARPPFRPVVWFFCAFVAMTTVALFLEIGSAWPKGSASLVFFLFLLTQSIVLTSAWTLPAAAMLVGLVSAGRRLGLGITAVPFVVFGSWLSITVGQQVHARGVEAVVRQDLASAVIPIAQLVLLLGAGTAMILAWRWLDRWLRLLPGGVLAAAAVGSIWIVSVAFITRWPDLRNDASFDAMVQVLVTMTVGVLALMVAGWLPVKRFGWRLFTALGALLLLFVVVMVYAGRLDSASYGVASGALRGKRLMASHLATLTDGVGDNDGDGFSGLFQALDCDDRDPKVHPMAKEIAGNGIDDDCFEGDLSKEAVAAERRRLLKQRQRPRRQRVRNVIVISSDAVRHDAVGFGGAKRPTSPMLDKLAKRSAVFRRAYAAAPHTSKAFPNLLAGRFPANLHWCHYGKAMGGHKSDLYLAEALARAGIKTGAVLGTEYARTYRYHQGFRAFSDPRSPHRRKLWRADTIVNEAIRFVETWYADGKRPRFYIWLHFYETHNPYRPARKFNFGKSEHDKYLASVRTVDHEIGRLLARLASLGLDRETAVFFTADHGEEFGEHGGKYHGDLYTEDLHVPLLIHIPGGRHVSLDTPVSLVDIPPTVLELMGVSIPQEYDGQSLLPWIESGKGPAVRHVFAEASPNPIKRDRVTLIGPRWQLIVGYRSGVRRLYDLQNDPTAQQNVLLDYPKKARQIEVQLRRFLALRIGPIRVTVP